MKALYFLMLICFACGINIPNASAQTEKELYSYSIDWIITTNDLGCLDEDLAGNLTLEGWMIRSKFHEKISGILTGQESRDEYTIDWISNLNYRFNPNAGTFGNQWIGHLRKDGRLIANFIAIYRYVWVNDMPIVTLESLKWNCN